MTTGSRGPPLVEMKNVTLAIDRYLELRTASTNGTRPVLLRGNEFSSNSIRTISLVFASFSLRASMIVLLIICSVVIYHVLLLVIRDLWKAHRELAASLGLDQCECGYYKERADRCLRRYCLPYRNNQDMI